MMIKNLSALILLSAFLLSCSTSNNVVNSSVFQKRKHNKGWHLKIGSNLKSINDSAKSEKNVDKNNDRSSKEIDQNIIQKTAKTILVSNEKIETIVFEKNQVKIKDENSSTKFDSSIPKDNPSIENLEKNTENSKQLEKEEENSNSQGGAEVSIVLLVILAILLPPAAVYLARGIGNEFWISLILTILFWFPGMIYAMLIVFDVI